MVPRVRVDMQGRSDRPNRAESIAQGSRAFPRRGYRPSAADGPGRRSRRGSPAAGTFGRVPGTLW